MLRSRKISGTHSRSGASMIELSLVILVISILISFSLPTAQLYLDQYRFTTAQKQLETISDALSTFQSERGYLPCPAVGTTSKGDVQHGVAVQSCYDVDSPPGTCPTGLSCSRDVAIGTLPFSTLGIDIAEGPFEKKITYAVDRRLTNKNKNLCVLGGSIIVKNNYGVKLTESVAYLVISHGKTGNGAYDGSSGKQNSCDTSRSDGENCNGDDLFIQSLTNLPDYDNIVEWRTVDNYAKPRTYGLANPRKPHIISGYQHTGSLDGVTNAASLFDRPLTDEETNEVEAYLTKCNT